MWSSTDCCVSLHTPMCVKLHRMAVGARQRVAYSAIMRCIVSPSHQADHDCFL